MERPLFGRSIELDTNFPYYAGRSVESIVSEIRANQYSIVRYVLTAAVNLPPTLLDAFHQQNMGVWYVTFCNGVWSLKDLPASSTNWGMVTRRILEGDDPGRVEGEFVFLCMNNPDYRAWKKKIIGDLLQAHPFDGVDLMEPHWPDYPGPIPESPNYGCFCDECTARFLEMFPEEAGLPDLLHPNGPRGEKGNPTLWAKWLQFRVQTVTDFLDDLVNGEDGIRTTAPQVKVCIWTLALQGANGLKQVREFNGEDAGLIASTVQPDLYGFQTHWPDWTQSKLKSDYVKQYQPFIQQVRAAMPTLPLLVQTDIGAEAPNRRSRKWIAEFEKTCTDLGVENTTCYEYFLGDYMYTDPPAIVTAERTQNGVALHFSKRLSPTSAENVAHYASDQGSIATAQLDGNIVHLTLTGVSPGTTVKITASNIEDDPSVRLFQDKPVTRLKKQTISVTL